MHVGSQSMSNVQSSESTPGPSRIRKIITDDEADKLSVRSLAENTQKKIQWAVKLFDTWQNERNHIAMFDTTISYIHPPLHSMTKDELNFSISRFICEVKKENGDDFPAQTLYELVVQLQLYLEQKGRDYKLISDSSFVQIKNTLDHMMKERSSSGIGSIKRKAEVITAEEEDMVWEKGILGRDSPQRLLDTLLYMIGLNFAFRAGLEHRNLRWENPQLQLFQTKNGECLKYEEDVSKSNQGGLASRKIKQKVGFAFPNVEQPERCLIGLYKDYISHCPEKKPDDAFYLRPLNQPHENVWFASVPVGIHSLRNTVSRLCKEAGLTGLRTNHSLRASASTRLYQAGFDEQMVSEITGHRSNAVREYKRTNEQMKSQ